MTRLWREALYRGHRWLKRATKPITLGARALVLDGDAVLLVRHTYQKGWYLPGGTVERGETLRTAAIRELAEEAGIEARAVELFGMYYSEIEGRSDHVALFVVRSFARRARAGASASLDGEIAEARFFPLSELPAEASPATRRRLAELAAGAPPAERW
jgi:ADP-ribose pyrophosphatase YjhB (NUDIX family)